MIPFAKSSVVVPCVLCLASAAQVAAQVHQVSPAFDSTLAPGADCLPGLRGGFRQQILIDPVRLGGLAGRTLTGFSFRRDLGRAEALSGGQISLDVRLSVGVTAARDCSQVFVANAPAVSQMQVFTGIVTVPNSPPLGSNPAPWGVQNSVSVSFASGFKYTGGTLCIELDGRPVPGKEPDFWYVSQEVGVAGGGSATPFGVSCSTFHVGGESLIVEAKGLQLGSTMRSFVVGRPGSSPLLLVGASSHPSGVDLSPTGALGCSLYVSAYVAIGLTYSPQLPGFPNAFANLELQIPSRGIQPGTRLFLQSADLETALPSSQWTNAAGLTTSNAVDLRVASTPPVLGMASVTSRPVDAAQPMPATGEVDVERAPVLRLYYR
ncbi:MAG: hypothetical protein KDC87_12375 [Planctomycetes bacterium]|nr:hypothetical protein [Planctomycetota bacterium]MCB9869368.1 hypothetical protein [Planctomycetota bacterium]